MPAKAKKVNKKTKNKKFNIAHLHWGFPPIIGGVETHLSILLPEFVYMGHNVSLLTSSAEGCDGISKYKGVDIIREPIMDLNWLYKRGLHGIEDEVREIFNKFIEKTKPDIVHTHNMHYFSKVHTNVLENICKEKGIPFFLTAHNVWDDLLFLDMIRDVSWTHIIAVSHFIRQELIGVGCNHRDITTVHHGIDQKLYHPKISSRAIYKKYPQLRGKRVVFHPARMGLAKGCDVSIKALRIVKEKFPDVYLVLAGTKNIIDWGYTQQRDIAYMIDLVEFFGLRNNVLIDAYKLIEIPMLYNTSEVCIYPSSSCEPFGLTMLEAMASAKPMIVTRAGGMPEIIRDGVNGFVVPVKDFEELANRIIQLLLDDSLRDRLGTTGRMIVEQQYTKENLAENTLNVYKRFV